MRRLLLVLACIFSFLILSSCDDSNPEVDIASFGAKSALNGEYKNDSICVTGYDSSALSMQVELKKEAKIKIEAIELESDEETLLYEKNEISSRGYIIKNETYDNIIKFKITHKYNNDTLKITDIKYDGKWQGKKLSNNKFEVVAISKDDFKFALNDTTLKVNSNKNVIKSIDYEVVSTDRMKVNIDTNSGSITFINDFKLEQYNSGSELYGNAVVDITIQLDGYKCSYKLLCNSSVIIDHWFKGYDEDNKEIYQDTYTYNYDYYWNDYLINYFLLF